MLNDLIFVFILIASSLFGETIESKPSTEDLYSLFYDTKQNPSNQKKTLPYYP